MSRYNRVSRMRKSRCTVELDDGSFCDADSAPDMPFPICARHGIQLYRYMHELVTEVRTDYRSHMDVHVAMVDGVRQERYKRDNSPSHRVYYVRVGDRIKIGMTSKLRQRIASYPPGSELLATEIGGEALESRRLLQFNHLLADRKEWFHPGPDLLDHIARLAEAA